MKIMVTILSIVYYKPLVLFNGTNYVFAYEGTKLGNSKELQVFEMREVKIGYTERGFFQISYIDDAEVSKGQLVLSGAYTLLAKSKNKGERHAH